MAKNLRTAEQRYEIWVLVATILGSSMAFIDATVVNVALPALQNVFGATVSQIQWVIEAYALTLSALLIVGGGLGDLYGRRRIFLIGVFLFGAASIWCGLAPSILQLIIARAVQGVGAALLVPGSLAIITAAFPEKRRGQAIGIWSGYTAITTVIGPVLGGWLVQHASWRFIFFLNIPIAIIVFFITVAWVVESKNQKPNQNLDIWGAVLATIGLGGIVFGLIEWESGTQIILLSEVIGFLALIGFFIVEATTSSPMVPLEIFKSQNFSGANLITFFLYFSLYGVLFFYPLDLIQIQGYTPTQAGAALLPFILSMFLLSKWAGGLVERVGARLPLVIGPAIVALAFGLLIFSDTSHSYWTSFFPAITVLGLGMAISVTPLTTVVMNSVALDHAGAASGINNAISRIAGLLAIAFLGLIMIKIFNYSLIKNLTASSLPKEVQQEIIQQRTKLADIQTTDSQAESIIKEAFTSGYQAVLGIAVGLSLASSLSALLLLKGKALTKD